MAEYDNGKGFVSLSQSFTPVERQTDANDPSLCRLPFDMAFAMDCGGSGPVPGAATIRVGLIDGYRFSQDCLLKAFADMSPRLSIRAFFTVESCLAAADFDADVMIYHAHVTAAVEAAVWADLATLRQALQAVPLIVMSDADDAQQPPAMRGALKSGARGFIPTRTTGIPMAFAVIRFVMAGGTFAPLDLLLDERPALTRNNPFTARQLEVLTHLQQGKSNKLIAHALSLSESTVKVHIRNIMRMMGATNRTQAAYKMQNWDAAAGAR